jgi:selenocysteine-specific elongation factor
MRVIGTAGHVDHGKSTLVRALSGIDPDRLKEEKARGMTIDLGFAWIDLRVDGRDEATGIVDVPGHIDFIKNMLAGVGGIDAAMLIVAADEGVMPQTREHLAILDLLAVPAGVVVLTKIDLVADPDWLELVELDIAELTAGTRLASAPVVRVSAASGQGLPALRKTLAELLAALPPRRDRARPRLPIDRIFTLSGFGTVVTGTLRDGRFTTGDTVEILPGGLSARIRGVQSHKKQIWSAEPGSRVAVNLAGVDVEQLHRGDVVVRPGALTPTTLIDVHLQLLGSVKALAHNQQVGSETVEPGDDGWLQLRLASPVAVVAGDRFILRQPSPSQTLGGGVVLSPAPRRRYKRFDPAALARMQVLAAGAPDEILLQTIERRPFANTAELVRLSELEADEVTAALAELQSQGALYTIDGNGEPLFATLDYRERLVTAILALVDGVHRQYPLRRGIPRSEIRSRLPGSVGGQWPLKLLNALLAALQLEGLTGGDETHIWRAGYRPQMTLEQQLAVDALLAEFARAPATPPNQPDALKILGNETELLEMLLAEGRVVRIGGDVLFRTADLDALIAAVKEHIERHGAISLGQARDLLQTSRKYVQALLEEMDLRRITRREGEGRVLR